MRAFLVLFAVFSFSSFAAETTEFDSKDINDVEIEITSGNVTLTAVEGAKATVVATKNKFNEKCRMKIEKQGDTLVIDVERVNTLSLDDCDVNFDVKVPKVVDVEVTIGTGFLSITGIKGDLDYTIGRGNVLADGTFEKIEGKTGSGDVAIKGLTGGGDVKMGSGKVDLTFATADLKGNIDLKTGAGDATLLFPKGTKVKTDFRAGTGDLTNELGDNPKADFRVSMKSGTGDLNVKTY